MVHKAIKAAIERNGVLRDAYTYEISVYKPFQLVFVDESAANERVGDRKKVWGPQGTGVVNPLPFGKGEKYSILPAFTEEGFLCQDILQGSFTAESFFLFVRDTLLPRCYPYPGKNSVIIMDNCQIHRGKIIREEIEKAGCILIMLPPYSPDFNPIELAFGVVKKWIARHHGEFAEAIIRDEMPTFFCYALSTITEAHACTFYRKTGYM